MADFPFLKARQCFYPRRGKLVGGADGAADQYVKAHEALILRTGARIEIVVDSSASVNSRAASKYRDGVGIHYDFGR